LQRPAFGVAGRLAWLAWLALCTEQKGFMISNPAGHLSWGHNRDLDLSAALGITWERKLSKYLDWREPGSKLLS
jgi:hypothetical protein